jgi:hypothetical protein
VAHAAGLARGLHEVEVTAAGRAAATFQLEAPARHDVELQPGLRLRGVLRERATGEPVGGARVRVGFGGTPVVATSRRDGSFEVADLPAGSLQLEVEAAGHRRLRRKVRAGGEPLELQLVARPEPERR